MSGEEVMAMADYGMKMGTPGIRSVGALAFGPEDVLFVADNASATVFAIDVADDTDGSAAQAFDVEDLDARLGAYLGCSPEDLLVRDMAVHPRTHNVYLSVMRGRGALGIPVIIKLDQRDASVSEVSLRDVAFSQAAISNAPSEDDPRLDFQLPDPGEGEEIEVQGHKIRIARGPVRTSTITDMAYVDGLLLVAGMSNEEFASNLRRIPFPFVGEMMDDSLEIFHVSHGKWETASPIRTFVPFDGGRSVLASYTCTPLVQFSLSDLEGGHATGKTVAELGAMNQPLDILSFAQGGDEYLLIANSRHPLMKMACADIEGQEPLTEPQEPRGVPYEELDIPGVKKLANLNGEYVLTMQRDDSGARHLRSLKTASL
jgi:hypothetical protein